MERGNPSVDRISIVPNDIMRKIQTFLPMQDIARMSVLAKKWRDKWKSVPRIILSDDCLVNKSEPLSRVITKILSEHQEIIETFSLSMHDAPSSDDFDKWLALLSSKDVQVISFSFGGEKMEKMSSHLFQCEKLKGLKLYCASSLLKLPPSCHWQGFLRLVTLILGDIEIEKTDLERLISSCPLLEQLKLGNVATEKTLVIQGSKLQQICFGGELEHIHLITPVLDKLSIHLYDPKNNGANGLEQGIEILGFPPSLQRFSLGSFWKFLKLPTMLKTFRNSFTNLNELLIDDLCLEDVNELSCFINAIVYARNLNKLFIKVCLHENHLEFPPVLEEFWKSHEEKKDCHLLGNLSIVTVVRFQAEDPELRFVEFLLSNLPSLQVMTIVPYSDDSYDQDDVMEEIMNYPRASSMAKVISLGGDELDGTPYWS